MKSDQAPARNAEPAAKTRFSAARPLLGRLPWPAAALVIAVLCAAAWLLIITVTTWLLR